MKNKIVVLLARLAYHKGAGYILGKIQTAAGAKERRGSPCCHERILFAVIVIEMILTLIQRISLN